MEEPQLPQRTVNPSRAAACAWTEEAISAQVWIARAICFLSFLGIANVVLAGCDTAYGRYEESSGKSTARPAIAAS
jgi:hypothetical protein